MDERSGDGHFPNGHFYSPVIDPRQVEAAADRIWPARPDVRGLDFNAAFQRRLLDEIFPRYIGDYDYPQTAAPETHPHAFLASNPACAWLDSRALFVLLRHWRPRNVIEVGSGYEKMESISPRRGSASCR